MNPNISNPFAPYKDSHAGTTAILCGSGPTLLEFDASLVPEGVLRFGVNDQIFLDLDLDYWFIVQICVSPAVVLLGPIALEPRHGIGR